MARKAPPPAAAQQAEGWVPRLGELVFPSLSAPRGHYEGPDGGHVIDIIDDDDLRLPYRVRWGNRSECNYAGFELTPVAPAQSPASPPVATPPGETEGRAAWEQDNAQRYREERDHYRNKERQAEQALASARDDVQQLQSQLRDEGRANVALIKRIAEYKASETHWRQVLRERDSERDALLELERFARLLTKARSIQAPGFHEALAKLDALGASRQPATEDSSSSPFGPTEHQDPSKWASGPSLVEQVMVLRDRLAKEGGERNGSQEAWSVACELSEMLGHPLPSRAVDSPQQDSKGNVGAIDQAASVAPPPVAAQQAEGHAHPAGSFTHPGCSVCGTLDPLPMFDYQAKVWLCPAHRSAQLRLRG
jgi:hypothetical protein